MRQAFNIALAGQRREHRRIQISEFLIILLQNGLCAIFMFAVQAITTCSKSTKMFNYSFLLTWNMYFYVSHILILFLGFFSPCCHQTNLVGSMLLKFCS